MSPHEADLAFALSELQAVENFYLSTINPSDFREGSTKNAVVEFENNFNSLCAALESAGHKTRGVTVMELYAKLKFFKDSKATNNI
jgi:hypothetical protein